MGACLGWAPIRELTVPDDGRRRRHRPSGAPAVARRTDANAATTAAGSATAATGVAADEGANEEGVRVRTEAGHAGGRYGFAHSWWACQTPSSPITRFSAVATPSKPPLRLVQPSTTPVRAVAPAVAKPLLRLVAPTPMFVPAKRPPKLVVPNSSRERWRP